MRCFLKNYIILVFILILTLVFLIGCSKQTQPTPSEEKTASTPVVKEEPVKPTSEPPKQQPPIVSEPPKKETPPAPSRKEPPPQAPVQPEIKEPAQRTTEVALSSVNLREGPSMKGRIIRVVKKGTKLIVLEEKLGWLHVRLEDGAEGWIAKSMTTEGTQPSPPKSKK